MSAQEAELLLAILGILFLAGAVYGFVTALIDQTRERLKK